MFNHRKMVTTPDVFGDMKKKYRHEKKVKDNRRAKAERKEEKRGQEFVQKTAEESKNLRNQGYEEGLARTRSLLDEDIAGLDDKRRQAMQYEANKAINRNYQGAQRKLLGQQGQRGVMGKSGVAYAQQRDLDRMQQEAEGSVVRDLDKLDQDLALKKKAAMFAGAQGESAQALLDRQQALDQLYLDRAKKEDSYWKRRANSNFNRV